MKLLMIGMDGAHLGAFNRGWTPFIESLLKQQTAYKVNNDLYSRGWLEIATGQHAQKTSAMYDRPKCGGSKEWTLELKFGDITPLLEHTLPLWHAVNTAGYRVGIMNLPTTFPAPQVDGFFVSGGGGGAPVTEIATDELCHPKEVKTILEDIGYIVDQRLYQLVVDKKKKDAKQIFEQMAFKNRLRTNAFIELDRTYNVDFGFIVYKTSSVFAETFYTTEIARRKNSGNVADSKAIQALEDYYRNFDHEIEKLRSAYPDAELIFVSDHGTEPRQHTVNPNILLEDIGLYTRNRSDSAIKYWVAKAKSLVPFGLKSFLKKNISKNIQSVGAFNFDAHKTRAFCKTYGDWRHGIYLNDVDRFGGCVKREEMRPLADEIVNAFNSHKSSETHGIKARCSWSYDGNPAPWYPDVVFELPDGYLTNDMSAHYVSEFKPGKSSSALQSIMRGDILSVKSHYPIVSSTIDCQQDLTGERDLTMVYDLIVGYFTRLEKS